MKRTKASPADTAVSRPDAGTPRTAPGRLTKDRFGWSTPSDAPLYPSLPYEYRDALSMVIMYETDEASALNLLPEGLDLVLPATAHFVGFHYPSTTIGSYNEAALSLNCLWQGQPISYIVYLAVTTDAAMGAGREIAGFPKKIAHIDLREEDGALHATVERPRGTRLVTASVTREHQHPPPPPSTSLTATLRVIPSPEKGQPPSLAELVQMSSPMNIHKMWSGPGSLSFDAHSDDDPWYRLPVHQIRGGIINRADFTLDHGLVLKTY